VTEQEDLARRFELHRGHLEGVAYRMLGSLSEADDAVQLTWLRLAGQDVDAIRDLRAWLTTVTSRICLDLLRSRSTRREEPLDLHLPDPVVTPASADPEEEAVLADSLGLALLVVLDTLGPAERLAFVLHDVFAVPFDQIGAILNRSPAAARQLASRARRRVREAGPAPTTDPAAQRAVLDAFLAAARRGDFEGLVAVLHPDVELLADAGDGPLGPSQRVTGARAVAEQAYRYRQMASAGAHALVNGVPGLVAAPGGRVVAVLSVTTVDGLITRLTILADPARLDRLHLPRFDPS
jgi:RNA polymerase sigma factor (sigma-70 family)